MMKLLFLLLPSAATVSMPDVSSAPSSLDISRKAQAKFQIYDNNGAVVGGDPATSCLPPHTVVGSEGCCTSTASPGKVAACSKTETPYGHCARNTLYPKPTPPHYHIAGQCPRRRPRPRLCLRRRPYLHCALVSQRRGLDQKSLTFTIFFAPSPLHSGRAPVNRFDLRNQRSECSVLRRTARRLSLVLAEALRNARAGRDHQRHCLRARRLAVRSKSPLSNR